MFSKPPPPPPSSPELDESALITAAVLVVLTIAALFFSKKAAMPPLKTPKELAAAKALRSKLSDPALLVEFGDADYEAVMRALKKDHYDAMSEVTKQAAVVTRIFGCTNGI